MKEQNKTPLGQQKEQVPSCHILKALCQLIQWKTKCHLYITPNSGKDVVVQLKTTKLK
jgi:hypothetical protein